MKKGCLIAFLSVFGTIFIFVVFIFVLVFIGSNGVDGMHFDSAPVAVIKIEGPIFEMDDTLKELERIRESSDIAAVVVRIDSPGGAVAPSQEVHRQLLRIKESGKKVIVSMGTVAASGGYYIACAADKIVANSGTITGSIGVIMENFGLQNVLQNLHIESRTIKSGKYKDAGTPFREMSAEEKGYLQNLSDNMYEIFIKDIAESRKMDLAKVDELAQGKIYTGKQAMAIGLVDRLGNLYDAIALAKVEANLPEDAEVKWPKEHTPFEALFDQKAMLQLLQKILMRASSQNLPTWSLPATGL